MWLINQCIGLKFEKNKINIAADLSSDIASITQSGNNWIVSFMSSEVKLDSFHHHIPDTRFSPLTIKKNSTLNENPLNFKTLSDADDTLNPSISTSSCQGSFFF